jgi:hypothetical protein
LSRSAFLGHLLHRMIHKISVFIVITTNIDTDFVEQAKNIGGLLKAWSKPYFSFSKNPVPKFFKSGLKMAQLFPSRHLYTDPTGIMSPFWLTLTLKRNVEIQKVSTVRSACCQESVSIVGIQPRTKPRGRLLDSSLLKTYSTILLRKGSVYAQL